MNNEDNFTPSQDDLRKKIVETTTKVSSLNNNIIDLQQNGQRVIDTGNALIPLVPFLDKNEMRKQFLFYSNTGDLYASLSSQVDDLRSSTDYAAGTASISSASAIGYVSVNEPSLLSNEGFLSAWDNFNSVVNNDLIFDKVIEKLKLLDLNKVSTKEHNPLEFFIISIEAYKRPVSNDDPSITSLLPMRQSISKAIEILLKYRPKQQKTGSSDIFKITDIGMQLKKNIVSADTVKQWANEWHDISDQYLSDSKKSIISRSEWSNRIYRSSHFYHSFLSGLDPSKFRKNV